MEDLGCLGNYNFPSQVLSIITVSELWGGVEVGFVLGLVFGFFCWGFFFGVSVFRVRTAVVGATLCYLEIKLLRLSLLCPQHTVALQNKHSAFWSHFSEGCREPAKGSHGMKNVELWEQHNCKQLCQ